MIRKSIFAAVLIGLACTAGAQTIPLSIDMAGSAVVQPMCAAARSGDNFTGVVISECPQTPPVNDPGAYTTLQVTWMGGGGAAFVDVTQFGAMWGRCTASAPVGSYPGCNGATLQWSDRQSRYLRVRFHATAGTHMIKPVSYGATPGARGSVALVPAGGVWPTVSGACAKLGIPFDDSPALYTTRCVTAGHDYDLLLDSTASTVAWSFF